jgi:hypothetical protein
MVRKKSLSEFRVIKRPPAARGPESLLLDKESDDDLDDDDLDDEESDDEDDTDEESESESESEDEEENMENENEKPRRGAKPATVEKMLLKLRMSSTRQQPVWGEAKDTLAERGFENSAKLAREIEAAIGKFRRVLDAEAKLRDAEQARRELDGIIAD